MKICWKRKDDLGAWKSKINTWKEKHAKKWNSRWRRACQWHQHFFLFPCVVTIGDHRCFLWLRTVQRRFSPNHHDELSGVYFYAKYRARFLDNWEYRL